MSLGSLCKRLLVLSISVSLLSFGLTAGSYHPLAYEPAFADGDFTFTFYELAGPAGLAGSYIFGSSVANIGDIDGDGIDDIAVGASGENSRRGAVYVILLDNDGSPKNIVKIDDSTSNGPVLSNGDFFGSSVANIGDIDGDGIGDIAVGASGVDSGASRDTGAIYIILLDNDGSPKNIVKIDDSTSNGPRLQENHKFGLSVAKIGEKIIAVGAPGDSSDGAQNRGEIHIIKLNSDGTLRETDTIIRNLIGGTIGVPGLSEYDQFGASVANIGDIDGDGIDDIAVGAPGDDTGGSTDRGAVYMIKLDSNHKPKDIVKIAHGTSNGPTSLSNGDFFGSSVANIGDIDGDGIDDIAVGAPGDDTGGSTNRGAVYIILLNGDGTPKKTVKIDDSTTGSLSLRDNYKFGSSVASIGDIDSNGRDNIAVGALGITKLYHMDYVTVPGKPTGLSTVPGTGQVALSWTAPAYTGGALITDYKIEYSNDGSSWSTFNDGTDTATTATVTGLTNAQQYSFRVTATNSQGDGVTSDAATETPHFFASPSTQTISATLDEPTCVISLAQENLALVNVQYSHWSDWATQTVTNDGNQQVTGMILDVDDWKASDGNKLDKAYSQIDKNGIKQLGKGSHNMPDEIPFNSGTIKIDYRINLEAIDGGSSAGKTFTQTVTYLATCS